jgi:HSP20 family protein
MMRARVHAVALPVDLGEFSDDVRRVFLELGRAFGPETLTGECAPAVDVFETDDAIEIAVDLPGVDPTAVRVIARAGALLIAGEKPAHRNDPGSTFHLLERGFGRFARVVRLGCPCDAARSRATLSAGELRISVPKIAERRGGGIAIRVEPR